MIIKLLQTSIFYDNDKAINLFDLPPLVVFAFLMWVGLIATGLWFLFVAERKFSKLPTVPSQHLAPSWYAGVALVLALSAQWALLHNRPELSAVFFLTSGFILAFLAQGESQCLAPNWRSQRNLLLFLMAGALFARLYRINEAFPAGVEQDEFLWALDYLTLLQDRSPFSAGSFGIPLWPGVVNLASMLVGGVSPLTVRLPSPFLGALSLVPIFFIGRWFIGGNAGLFAAAVLAFSNYYVFYGRIISGSRMVLTVALGFACLVAAWRLGRSSEKRLSQKGYLLAGAICGLALHDYFAVRWVPVFLIVVWILIAVADIARGGLNAFRCNVFLFFAPMFLSISPLLWQSIRDPVVLTQRMGQESQIARFLEFDWEFITAQLKRSFLFLNVSFPEGRSLWFSLSAISPLDFVTGALFGAGAIGVCFGALMLHARELLLFAAFVGAVSPTLLSSWAPDTHRAVLVNIPAALIIGWAVQKIVTTIRFPAKAIALYLVIGVLTIPPLVSLQEWFKSDRFYKENLFHAHWHRRIQNIQELIPNSAKQLIGSRELFPNTELVLDRDFFIGIKLLFPGMHQKELTAATFFPSTPSTTKIVSIAASNSSGAEIIRRIYPDAAWSSFQVGSAPEEKLVLITPAEQSEFRCGTGSKCINEQLEFAGDLYIPAPSFVSETWSETIQLQESNGCALVGSIRGTLHLMGGRLHRIMVRCRQIEHFNQLKLRRITPEPAKTLYSTFELSDLLVPSSIPVWHGRARFDDGTVTRIPDMPVIWGSWDRGLGYWVRKMLEQGRTISSLSFWSDNIELLETNWTIALPTGSIRVAAGETTLLERTAPIAESGALSIPAGTLKVDVEIRDIKGPLKTYPFAIVPRGIHPFSESSKRG